MSDFIPRKMKWRKPHKGNKGHILGLAPVREYSCLQGGNAAVYMGSNIRVSSKHFGVMRLMCSKILKTEKRGSFKFITFPNRCLTKKAAETRMGSGKGAPESYVAMMRCGDVLVEFFDVPKPTVERIYSQMRCKIPGILNLIYTGDYNE